MNIKKYLGQGDVYLDIMQKYLARVSSVMIWIGFFTYMSTMFEAFLLVIALVALVLIVLFLIWFDVKYILPNKQKYLGNKNPFLNDMWKDIKKLNSRESN